MLARPKLSDIARAVGVSTSAVSLALRGEARVSAETAERIRAEARRIGYVQNKAAAGLRTARSEIVGVCLNDLSNPVFNEFLIHVEAELRQAGQGLFLGVAREDVAVQTAFVRSAIEHGVGGFLICPVRGTKACDLAPLMSSETRLAPFPCALFSRTLSSVDLPQVGNDDHLAGRLMAQRLRAAGHERIHWIGGGHDSSTSRDRFAGLRDALAEADAPPPAVWIGPTSRQFGYETAGRILRGGGAGAGIACFSDLIAFGVLAACTQLGMPAGRAVSVIGCDDMEEAAFSNPPLTSIWIDKATIGRTAAQRVLAKEPKAASITRVPPAILERETVIV